MVEPFGSEWVEQVPGRGVEPLLRPSGFCRYGLVLLSLDSDCVLNGGKAENGSDSVNYRRSFFLVGVKVNENEHGGSFR
jgi:hypothetical protein